MLTVEKVDIKNKQQVDRFVKLQFRLYEGCKEWVPPFIGDIKVAMNPDKHPYYEHAYADFYIAVRDGRDVGRIAALVNTSFNEYHRENVAQFYFFECEDDQEAANALFERVIDWSKQHKMDRIMGPKGLGPLDGYGVLIEGYEHRPIMTMQNYNHSYYPRLVEGAGFEKEVDFWSCHVESDSFSIPDKAKIIAKKVLERGSFEVKTFRSGNEIRKWANRIGKLYNNSMVANWEYYPLTEGEIKLVVDNIILGTDPKLIKLILKHDDLVGYLFGFPDLSDAMQRGKGKVNPLIIADLLLEKNRTKWVAVNGQGILPDYQGRGGNALMYYEMENTVRSGGRFKHADMTQVADTAVQMRKDLVALGGKVYKVHRVYRKAL